MVFVGGSHASRLAEAARSTYPEVVDVSIGGWKLTKESAAEVALDLAGVLDDATDGSHTIVLHIFDNSIYKGEAGGELTDPVRINRKYHIEGKLVVLDHPEFKRLFETALPIFRSCTGSNIILLGPLPRYLLSKCCTEPSHVTNFGETGQRYPGPGQAAEEPGSHPEIEADKGPQPRGADGGNGLGGGRTRETAETLRHRPCSSHGGRLHSHGNPPGRRTVYSASSAREEPIRRTPASNKCARRPEAHPQGVLDRWHPGGGPQER